MPRFVSGTLSLLAILLSLQTFPCIYSETWTANCNNLQFAFDRTNQVAVLRFNTSGSGLLQMAKGTIGYDDEIAVRAALDGNDVGYMGFSLTEIELNLSQGAVNIQYRNPSNGIVTYSLFCKTSIMGAPSNIPSKRPTKRPTRKPSTKPLTTKPVIRPPTRKPSRRPTRKPTPRQPSKKPTRRPTSKPTRRSTRKPTTRFTKIPTKRPTKSPTKRPSRRPTSGKFTRSPTNNVSSNDTLSSYYFTTSENPTLISYFIDPVIGSDTNNNGTTLLSPFRTVGAAWSRIPKGATLTNTGYIIQLAPGNYTEYVHFPSYWESRYGTYSNPIIIQGMITINGNIHRDENCPFKDSHIFSGKSMSNVPFLLLF